MGDFFTVNPNNNNTLNNTLNNNSTSATALTPPPIPILTMSRFSRDFRVLSHISSGGFGSVYECESLYGARYAIKKVTFRLSSAGSRNSEMVAVCMSEFYIYI